MLATKELEYKIQKNMAKKIKLTITEYLYFILVFIRRVV